MKFFDREEQIERLQRIRERSAEEAQFTVITGRRRVGKTELVQRALSDRDFVYLFVSRKSERDLVEGFVAETNRVLPDAVSGEVRTLAGFFKELFKLARTQTLTVFIDEFQDFRLVCPSVFSTIQELWDREHHAVRMNLVVCGSINTLMNRIFLNRKEPLYGRQTALMRVEPFSTSVLQEILAHHKRRPEPEDLLALWALTGGVAKYVALLMDEGATNLNAMLKVALSEDSFFLEEGRILLNDEFGKDSVSYFSILSALSRGITTRNEIEQAVGRSVGGYLTRLERDYHLVSRHVPFGAKTQRQMRYQIEDPFYRFWFRFIFKYDYIVQMKAFPLLRKIAARDYAVFSGAALESYFRTRLVESGEWTRVGNWWDRKGENEIDIIAENEVEGKWLIAEVKRDLRRIDLDVLRRKYAAFAQTAGIGKTQVAFAALSLKDMMKAPVHG